MFPYESGYAHTSVSKAKHVFKAVLQNGTTVKHTISAEASLMEMLEFFQHYLNACGYAIGNDKYIDLVDCSTGEVIPDEEKK